MIAARRPARRAAAAGHPARRRREELDGWRQLPGRRRRARRPGRPAGGRRAPPRSSTCGRSPSRRSTSTAIESGSPHLQKTVLPVEADANVSIRLAPGQEPDEIADAFERLLREAAPRGRRARGRALSSAAAGMVAPDARGDAARARRVRARARQCGRLLIRSGGTLPIVPALADARDPHDHHRLLAARRQHPLAQRADAGRVRRRSGSPPRRRCSASSPRCSAPFRPARPWVRRPPWHQGGRTEPFVTLLGLLAAAAALLVLVAQASAAPSRAAATDAHLWLTTPDGQYKLTDMGTVPFGAATPTAVTAVVDPPADVPDDDGLRRRDHRLVGGRALPAVPRRARRRDALAVRPPRRATG